MIQRKHERFDPALTRRAIEAKLYAEGFERDTDDRRRLVEKLTSPALLGRVG
jgi:hypothetical protein